MSENIADPPQQTSLVDAEKDTTGETAYIVTPVWFQTFVSWIERMRAAPQVLKVVSLVAQSGAIGTTPIPLASIGAGLYRVTYYMRVTVPASVNSSVTFSVSWPDGGVSQTASGAAMTGNTTTTVQSGSIMMQVDALGPISYSTAYSSTGTAMQYSLKIMVEQVSG